MDMMDVWHGAAMAQPHPVTLSGGLVHFQTDMDGLMQITGTGNITVCGKNLFNSYVESGGFNSSTGAEADNNKRLRSGFIFMKSGKYTISASSQKLVIVYIYNTNKQFLRDELINVFTYMPYTFTLAGDRYVRFIWRKDDNSQMSVSDLNNVQTEVGDVSTSYTAYSGDKSAILTGRKSLGGINNVFSDSGNITVTYWTH